MADFGYFPGKYDSEAVEDLLSQAKDLYVLEQVAAINCSGFTDSSLPTNLETRFRRLKSLPVSRPDPLSSSNKKLLSHSKTMASSPSTDAKTNFSGNFPNPSEETRIFSGIKRDPSANSGFEKNFCDSGKIGSSSSRFSRESEIFPGIKRNLSVNSGFEKNLSDSGKIGSSSSRFSRESKNLSGTSGDLDFSPTTVKLLPEEKLRMSSSSFTSIDLSSPSSYDPNPEKAKPKSKFSNSWFGKLSSPSLAMGRLSGLNSKLTKKSSSKLPDSEELKRAQLQRRKLKIAMKESKKREREVDRLVRRSRALRGPFWFLVC